MKDRRSHSSQFPLALLLGKKMDFEKPQMEKYVYDSVLQKTEVFHFGETGSGKIGTKSLKTVGTTTGKKTKTSTGDYVSDNKNEIDDSKSKD